MCSRRSTCAPARWSCMCRTRAAATTSCSSSMRGPTTSPISGGVRPGRPSASSCSSARMRTLRGTRRGALAHGRRDHRRPRPDQRGGGRRHRARAPGSVHPAVAGRGTGAGPAPARRRGRRGTALVGDVPGAAGGVPTAGGGRGVPGARRDARADRHGIAVRRSGRRVGRGADRRAGGRSGADRDTGQGRRPGDQRVDVGDAFVRLQPRLLGDRHDRRPGMADRRPPGRLRDARGRSARRPVRQPWVRGQLRVRLRRRATASRSTAPTATSCAWR